MEAVALATHTIAAVALAFHTCPAVTLAKHTITYAIVHSIYV
jgi:hypothetical protein